MNAIQTVNFHEQSLITLQKDGVAYVAMKPICENIGLDWEAQRQRISRDEVLNSVACMIQATANDKKNYQMLCLPIHYLNGWLFGVDVSRVKEKNRDKLITYKKECYQVLFDYWHKGVAVNENHYHNTFNHITVMPPLCGKEFLVRIQDDGTWAMRELGGDEYVLNMKQMDAGHLPYGLKQLHSIHKLSLVNALSQSLTQDYLQDVRNAKNIAGFLD